MTSYLDDGGEYTKRFLFTLRKGEIETFYLWAEARNGSYEWIGRLQYVVDGKRRVIQIDNDGRPFHTTAATRAQSFSWYRNQWWPQQTSDKPEQPA